MMRYSLFIFIGVLLASCQRETKQFNLSLSDVLDQQSKDRGTIIVKKGFDGPFHEEGTFIGNFNTAGSIRAGKDKGKITYSWDAVPGYFFEATAYTNSKEEGFIIVRKVSEAETRKAEQGAAANP
jgi:hypothetical protein